jgi:predicted acyl esterase
LRIEISSSNFPQFDRNLNTGGENYNELQGVIAHSEVDHSAQLSVEHYVKRREKVSVVEK